MKLLLLRSKVKIKKNFSTTVVHCILSGGTSSSMYSSTNGLICLIVTGLGPQLQHRQTLETSTVWLWEMVPATEGSRTIQER